MQGDLLFFGRKVFAESFDELRRCCLEKVDTTTNGPGCPAFERPDVDRLVHAKPRVMSLDRD